MKWNALVRVIQEYFTREPLQVVSFDEWMERLEASGKEHGADAVHNPGLKLLGMFQGLKNSGGSLLLDTKVTQEKSKVMQSLPEVGKTWMKMWLEQWAL